MSDFFKQLANAFSPAEPEAAKKRRTRRGYLYWGGEWIPSKHMAHYFVMGMPRSGKTTLFRGMMQSVLSGMVDVSGKGQVENLRALIYDPKDEMHSVLDGMGLGECIVTVDPNHTHSSSWAIHKDVVDDLTGVRVSNALTPTERDEKGDVSFFTTTSRNITSALFSCFSRSNRHWTFRDVLLAMIHPTAMTFLFAQHDDTVPTLQKSLQGRRETMQDVDSTIVNLFNRWKQVAALWHHAEKDRPGFSVSEWFKSNKILLLPTPSGAGDPRLIMNQVIFDYLAEELLKLPETSTLNDPPLIWLFIDELRQAGELRMLKEVLNRGASKGARVVVGPQGIEGLRDAYNENRAEEILGLCAYKAFLRAGSHTTAEWMSNCFGSQLRRIIDIGITTSGNTTSHSRNERETEKRLVPPIEFQNLDMPEINGKLEGYFIAPDLKGEGRALFHNAIPIEKFYGPSGLVKPRGTMPDKAPRPGEQQNLLFWTEEDLQRLGLPLRFLQSSNTGSSFQSINRQAFEN